MQETTLGKQTNELLYKENTTDNLIKGWKFFLPKIGIVKRILMLNEKIGEEYFQKQYNNLLKKEGNDNNHESLAELEENLKDISWHKRLYNQISEILQHNHDMQPSMSDDEFLLFSQKYISEKIYNHLAMLSRSPHAQEEGVFSLREELTEELAEKIGLGLYLTNDISPDLISDVKIVLHELAKSFEDWFTNEQQGNFSSIFGEIYSPNVLSKIPSNKKPSNILILEPDARQGKAFTSRN